LANINSGGIIYLHFLYSLHTPSSTHKIHTALDALQLIKGFKARWDKRIQNKPCFESTTLANISVIFAIFLSTGRIFSPEAEFCKLNGPEIVGESWQHRWER
jgi:hypothetical protein